MAHVTPMFVHGQMVGDSAPSMGSPPHGLVHPLSRVDPRSHPPVRSLYIHVPFCFHKCHYCDFYSIVDTQDRQEALTHRLLGELRLLAPHAAGRPLRTIFVGGGTPSLLRVE